MQKRTPGVGSSSKRRFSQGRAQYKSRCSSCSRGPRRSGASHRSLATHRVVQPLNTPPTDQRHPDVEQMQCFHGHISTAIRQIAQDFRVALEQVQRRRAVLVSVETGEVLQRWALVSLARRTKLRMGQFQGAQILKCNIYLKTPVNKDFMLFC